MLILEMTNGEPTARQWIRRPLAYLDHWAWMDLADNEPLAACFVKALLAKGGTVAFSDVNWLECSDVRDLDRLRRMEGILRGLEQNIFFIEMDPAVVEARIEEKGPDFDEAEVLAGLRLLYQYGGYPRNRMNQLDPELFLTYLRSPTVGDTITRIRRILEQGWSKGITEARTLMNTDSGRVELRKGATAAPTRLPVRAVHQAAMYQAVKCGMSASDASHARDYFHLVVPLSSCDVLVLDANGKERARQVQLELSSKGRLSHEARVFNDLEEALKWLEAA